MPGLKKKKQIKMEMLFLMPIFFAIILYLLFIASDMPIIHEVLKSLHKCKIDDCKNIAEIVSIIGTFFVILTLIITVFSLIISNIKYRSQMSDMNTQHRDQMSLMNRQIQILIQNSRMGTLKEYLIASSRYIYSYIDEGFDNGLFIMEGRSGVIFQWSFIKESGLVEYLFRAKFRSYSPNEDNPDEILKDHNWHNHILDVIQFSNGNYVMAGISGLDGTYFPIEKVFRDMNDNDYNAIILVILSLMTSEKSRLETYKENFIKHRENRKA